MNKEVQKAVRALQTQLALPTGFLSRLQREDDWSFVIKCHTLMEASLTFLLVSALQDKRTEDFVSRLSITNRRTGKLALVQALHLLDADHMRFIEVLSTLRNQVAHRIENVSFTFEKHVSSLPEKARKDFLNGLDAYSLDVHHTAGLRDKPKLLLWLGLLIILTAIHISHEILTLDQKTERQKLETEALRRAFTQ